MEHRASRRHGRRRPDRSFFVAPLLRLVFALAVLPALFIAFSPGGEVSTVLALPSSVSEFQPNLSTKFGGRSTAVDINPSDPNTVISAAESGGLFKSTDGGSTWSHIDTLVPYRMNDVKYAPNNASLVLTTTWANGDSVNPGGIWRSTDGGATWQRPPSLAAICGGNFNAHGIAFEPSTTNIYIATDCGLAVSFNAGVSWTLQAFERAHAVYAHPNATIDVCTDSGHRRFTRTGTTLTAVGGLNLIPGAGGGGCDQRNGLASPHDLSADPGDPQVLFVVKSGTSTTLCGGTVATPAGLDFLYESDNGGVAWTQIDSMCNPVRQPWVVSHRSRNGNANDFDIYYSQGFSVLRLTCTTNVGGVGQRCTGPGAGVTAAHPDPSLVAFKWDSSNCAQFLVNDGGIEESGDCGATFSFLSGSGSSNGNYNALQVYGVNGPVHPPAGHTDLFFGAQDNRNWGSGDGGATWPNQDCCEGDHFQLPHSAASDAGQRVVYFTCGPPCPYRMAGPHLTGAANWPNPAGTDPGADIGSPVLIQGTTDTYVQWTQPTPPTNQLNRTTNAGGAWTAITGATITQPLMSIPMVSGPPGDPTIYQAFCTVNCGFVAPAGGIMKITGAMGATATVTNITAGLGTLGTYNDGHGAFLLQEPALGVDPNNPLHLIAADVGGNRMRQSRDGGATWTADLPLTNLVTDNGRLAFGGVFFVGSQARAIAFSPANSNIILVGTESAGILASFDNGNTWSKLIGSEKVTSITSFFFDEVNNEIFVSSYGRGLWKVSLPSADLSITKTHSPEPATAGEELYYYLSVTNDGPDAATDVIVVDQLPPEVTFVTDNLPPPAGCTANSPPPGTGQTVTCNLGAIASGDTVFFTIKVAVNANAVSNAGGPLSITNTATVTSAGVIDPDGSNNTAVDTVIVEDKADLGVTKLCKPDTNPQATQPIGCTVFVDNYGPSDARGVVVDDVMLSNGTFTVSNVSPALGPGTPGCTLSNVTGGQKLTCRLGTVAAASTTVPGRATITYTISVTEGQDINNLATVRSDTPDPDASNNQAQVTLTVQSVADLALTKSAAATVVAGTNLTYTLTVTNNGPSTASNVVVQDTLPAHVTIVSVSGTNSATCNAGTPGDPFLPTTCNFDTVPPAASRTMTIVVTVDPDVLGPIQNDARASSDTFDDENDDNLANVTTNVTAEADLMVTKTATPNPVVAGTALSYQINVSNAGPSLADDVVVTDVLPASLTFNSASTSQGSCGFETNTNTVQCQVGDIMPGETVTVYIYTTVLASTLPSPPPITNTATAASNTSDPNGGNNSSTVNTGVVTKADLSITLMSDKDVYKPSTTIHYTITVMNLGPSDAQGVVVTQVLPPPKTGFYVGNNAGCPDPVGQTWTCPLGTIEAGGTRVIHLDFFIRGNKRTIIQTATVSSATTDPVPGNNSSTRIVTVK